MPLVQEVIHGEFNWIHPKWIGQESRSSVTAKVSHQHFPGMPWGCLPWGSWNAFSSRMAFFPISFPSRLHTRLGALLTALEEPVCLNNLIKEEQRDSFPLLFQQKKAVSLFIAGLPLFFLTRPALKMEVKIPEISFDYLQVWRMMCKEEGGGTQATEDVGKHWNNPFGSSDAT